ncbi:uncharacterized protein LOC130743039 isoform X2 [Lotus japonicus]|uniref:uncharacterized protein LOC130743039 isoform X2 n=1 Tax=Lotus japonicus TaxID=34305 RepID=UPI002584E49B|nr:uncharacterized protein LOC130743039 isoform X2 [Lotus japonicus]
MNFFSYVQIITAHSNQPTITVVHTIILLLPWRDPNAHHGPSSLPHVISNFGSHHLHFLQLFLISILSFLVRGSFEEIPRNQGEELEEHFEEEAGRPTGIELVEPRRVDLEQAERLQDGGELPKV